MPETKAPRAPRRPKIQQVAASRDVQGSPWGGGGFVDYGGAAAAAFQDQLDYADQMAAFQEQRKAYEKSVRDAELKEYDADFGMLQSVPSGVGGFDGATEAMAREWKAEYAQAKRDYDKGLINPADFSAIKSRLFGNAAQFKQASEILNQTVAEYQKAVDEGTISNSTPPEIRDALSTLANGGEGLTVANINGVPTLTGTTMQGMPINVPISEIASGKNTWRFNTKVDTESTIDKITNLVGNRKIKIQQPDGTVLEQAPAWEDIEGTVDSHLEKLVNNESSLRAIAADQFRSEDFPEGIDSLTFEQLQEQDPEQLKQIVKNFLGNQVRERVIPQQLESVSQRRFQPSQQRYGGPTSAIINQANRVQQQQQNMQLLDQAIQSGDLRSLTGRGQILSVSEPGWFGSDYTVKTKNGNFKINPNNPGDVQILSNLLGINAPLQTEQPAQGASAEADPLGLGI